VGCSGWTLGVAGGTALLAVHVVRQEVDQRAPHAALAHGR